MYEHSRGPLFTTFRSVWLFPVTTNRDEISKSMSQPFCWRGSAKATHLFPVNARLWSRLGTACEISTSLNSSNFSDPGGELFSFVDPIKQLESVKLVSLSAFIGPVNVTEVSQNHPRAFFYAPRATRVNPLQQFLMCNVALSDSKPSFLPFVSLSEMVSCETGPNESLLY